MGIFFFFFLRFHGCCKPEGAMNSFGEYWNRTEVSNGCATCHSCCSLVPVNFRSGSMAGTERCSRLWGLVESILGEQQD